MKPVKLLRILLKTTKLKKKNPKNSPLLIILNILDLMIRKKTKEINKKNKNKNKTHYLILKASRNI